MQGINVFATTTARDAAITAPAEGQFAFTKDTNSLWYYDGAAWVASGATGDIEGVTAGIGISGGGTSGTVTVTNSMATAIDAKGDLVPGTGADTFARLAVGANDTVLTADSTTATGLKWASASTAGAATITVSGISNVDNLMIIVINASSASAGSDFTFRFNSDSGSNYIYGGMQQQKGSDFTKVASSVTGDSNIFFGVQGNNAGNAVCGYLQVLGAAGSGNKAFQTQSAGDGTSAYQTNSGGVYEGTSTISSVSIISGVGNFDAGTILVYGA
jgi:hypothetical protein